MSVTNAVCDRCGQDKMAFNNRPCPLAKCFGCGEKVNKHGELCRYCQRVAL